MKKMKKYLGMIFMILVMLVATNIIIPEIMGCTTVEAATVQISKKNVMLIKGKTIILKITGTKSKVKWSTNNKKVATVTSGGKVTAKEVGATTIKAVVSKKTYTCKVTVKSSSWINDNSAALGWILLDKEAAKYFGIKGEAAVSKIEIGSDNNIYYTFTGRLLNRYGRAFLYNKTFGLGYALKHPLLPSNRYMLMSTYDSKPKYSVKKKMNVNNILRIKKQLKAKKGYTIFG